MDTMIPITLQQQHEQLLTNYKSKTRKKENYFFLILNAPFRSVNDRSMKNM